ncbi:MAG: hypothetical protein KatS3mg124_1038 [Porticoccaceae bacterium]|nr:MAG: hypothetical protein KatS3mg124_1038 [Porticoccaceae bacterium]
MLLNCDLAEGDPRCAREARLMPHLDLANVACGLHAGGPLAIARTLELARRHGVAVGAHPGYHDPANFGRVSHPHTAEELAALLHYQLGALEALAERAGVALYHLKPHGALYHDMAAEPKIFTTLLEVLARRGGPRCLVVPATPDPERLLRLAAPFGVRLLFEAFADRRYDARGGLLPRRQPGAVLDRAAMEEQVARLLEEGCVETAAGTLLPLAADTLCLHGDTPDAEAAVARLRALVDGVRRR